MRSLQRAGCHQSRILSLSDNQIWHLLQKNPQSRADAGWFRGNVFQQCGMDEVRNCLEQWVLYEQCPEDHVLMMERLVRDLTVAVKSWLKASIVSEGLTGLKLLWRDVVPLSQGCATRATAPPAPKETSKEGGDSEDDAEVQQDNEERLVTQGRDSDFFKRAMKKFIPFQQPRRDWTAPEHKEGVLRKMNPQRLQRIRSCEDIWSLDPVDRVLMAQAHLQEVVDDASAKLGDALAHFENLSREEKVTDEGIDAMILRRNRILGMTITGACIHAALVREWRPDVVLVEEAAEVLESQLLAALSPSVSHLIMIGDHEQLPPQVKEYPLKKHNGFDVSMLERLVRNNLPHVSLRRQSRMHPDISALLQPTYPQLLDNTSVVALRAQPECIRHRCFFWACAAEEMESEGSTSRVNTEEAERVACLALFFVSQGFSPCQITILTAYQRQTLLVRKLLSKKLPAYLQEAGLQEAIQLDAGSADPAAARKAKVESTIQAQTIDRFQGDENDIVLVSLVRSNKDNKVGYLGTGDGKNRLCVAQSRARCCMVFVGNSDCLRAQRTNHWSGFLQMLENRGCHGEALPLVCPRHPDVSPSIRSSADIPYGQRSLCGELCGAPMGCGTLGHLCERPCHPQIPKFGHSALDCRHVVSGSHDACTAQPRHEFKYACCMSKSKFASPCPFEESIRCTRDPRHGLKRRCGLTVEQVVKKCSGRAEFSCLRNSAHKLAGRCSEVAEEVSERCKEPCKRLLVCGHECQSTCHDGACPEECEAPVERRCVNDEMHTEKNVVLMGSCRQTAKELSASCRAWVLAPCLRDPSHKRVHGRCKNFGTPLFGKCQAVVERPCARNSAHRVPGWCYEMDDEVSGRCQVEVSRPCSRNAAHKVFGMCYEADDEVSSRCNQEDGQWECPKCNDVVWRRCGESELCAQCSCARVRLLLPPATLPGPPVPPQSAHPPAPPMLGPDLPPGAEAKTGAELAGPMRPPASAQDGAPEPKAMPTGALGTHSPGCRNALDAPARPDDDVEEAPPRLVPGAEPASVADDHQEGAAVARGDPPPPAPAAAAVVGSAADARAGAPAPATTSKAPPTAPRARLRHAPRASSPGRGDGRQGVRLISARTAAARGGPEGAAGASGTRPRSRSRSSGGSGRRGRPRRGGTAVTLREGPGPGRTGRRGSPEPAATEEAPAEPAAPERVAPKRAAQDEPQPRAVRARARPTPSGASAQASALEEAGRGRHPAGASCSGAVGPEGPRDLYWCGLGGGRAALCVLPEAVPTALMQEARRIGQLLGDSQQYRDHHEEAAERGELLRAQGFAGNKRDRERVARLAAALARAAGDEAFAEEVRGGFPHFAAVLERARAARAQMPGLEVPISWAEEVDAEATKAFATFSPTATPSTSEPDSEPEVLQGTEVVHYRLDADVELDDDSEWKAETEEIDASEARWQATTGTPDVHSDLTLAQEQKLQLDGCRDGDGQGARIPVANDKGGPTEEQLEETSLISEGEQSARTTVRGLGFLTMDTTRASSTAYLEALAAVHGIIGKIDVELIVARAQALKARTHFQDGAAFADLLRSIAALEEQTDMAGRSL
ncbi:unnamed protein product [Prorocentrum cordatum]|uniref:NF-X1-type domain-containing protein n=1 Tax=Prorocentrum cordatum TaxID=2364126 RepID=A0ABN9QU41_9DINO|nr:unnamed protein product [Polarella glacialis]